MKTSRNTARVRAALFLAAFLCAGATASAAPRSVALVDFTVQGTGGEHSWLGPAMAELLRAKMQFFEGSRVLERTRVRSLLGAAGAEGIPEADDALLLAVIPAEILVAGSVTISPGEDPRRIRVHARAFETATSKIISEATFSGETDLPGILAATEVLARSLAGGLGLSFTAEQLAYAEPEGIASLKLFVEGNRLFDDGRFREAIETYQRSLDGNAGRFFPAAHRAQGEAYRALAGSLSDSEAGAVRSEYLEKFRRDALAASGALFDLGLAYETNGMWEEAIEAYDDYLDAVGSEGKNILWILDHSSLVKTVSASYKEGWVKAGLGETEGFIAEGDELVHLIPSVHLRPRGRTWNGVATILTPRLFSLDARTGEIVRELVIEEVFGEADREVPPTAFHLIGIEGDTLFLRYRRDGRLTVASLSAASQVLWKRNIGRDQTWEYGVVDGGRILCATRGEEGPRVVMLDSGDGSILTDIDASRAEPKGDYYPTGAVDLDKGVLLGRDGTVDLTTGEYASYSAGEGLPQGSTDLSESWRNDQFPRATGVAGVWYRDHGWHISLYREGRGATFLENWDVSRRYPPAEGGRGPLLLEKPLERERWGGPFPRHFFTLLDPDTMEDLELYRDYPGEVYYAARTPEKIAFVVRTDQERFDPRYDLPSAETTMILNVFELPSAALISRTRLPNHRWDSSRYSFSGEDMIAMTPDKIFRVKVESHGSIITVPVTEALYHSAICHVNLGRSEGAA